MCHEPIGRNNYKYGGSKDKDLLMRSCPGKDLYLKKASRNLKGCLRMCIHKKFESRYVWSRLTPFLSKNHYTLLDKRGLEGFVQLWEHYGKFSAILVTLECYFHR